jgi:hypothetical protein
MLLREIIDPGVFKEINEATNSSKELNVLCEGLGDGFIDFFKTMRAIMASSGKKSELNDRVIGVEYRKAKEEFNVMYSDMKYPKIKEMYDKILMINKVKLDGVELSRNNIKKLAVLKLLVSVNRAIKAVIKQVFENEVTEKIIVWIVSIIFPILAPIVAAMFVAKNVVELAKAAKNVSGPLAQFYKKANEARKRTLP